MQVRPMHMLLDVLVEHPCGWRSATVPFAQCAWMHSSSSTSCDAHGKAEQDSSDANTTSRHAPPFKPGANTHTAIRRMIRECHAAEVAASSFFQGQALVSRHRPDIEMYKDQEQEALEAAKKLIPQSRARPSALQGLLRAGGIAAGAATALAPTPLRLAVWGAVGDALTEHYNDSLRRIREHELQEHQDAQEQGVEVEDMAAANNAEVIQSTREAVRQLRDIERVPQGAPPPPDIVTLQKIETLGDIGFTGLAAFMAKTITRTAIQAASRI